MHELMITELRAGGRARSLLGVSRRCVLSSAFSRPCSELTFRLFPSSSPTAPFTPLLLARVDRAVVSLRVKKEARDRV